MKKKDPRHVIARRAAEELRDGDVVNLGIGMPVLVLDYLPSDITIHLHTENGMLGMGPLLEGQEPDPQIINAAKMPVRELPGTSYFDSATSFAMVRGAHLDVAMLGALQVDERGRVANWTVPGQDVLGIGGAMDLLVGARRVIVLMTHLTKDGRPKIVRQCTYPLTATRPADTIVTDYAVFKVTTDGLVLVDLQDGVSLEQVRKHTEARFAVALESGKAV